MSTESHNRFADGVKWEEPIVAELAQPITPEANPYASPREASQPTAEQIGLWRDGKFLVAHRESAFPTICVRTNDPAQRAFRCRLLWSYPIDIARRSVTFDVGLCESCIRKYQRVRLTGWVMIVLGTGLLVLLMLGMWRQPPVLSALGVVGLLFAGLSLAGRPGVRLSIKRVRGPYFWIRGAHRGYLDRLPDWPGSRG